MMEELDDLVPGEDEPIAEAAPDEASVLEYVAETIKLMMQRVLVLDPDDPEDTELHVAIGQKLYEGMHVMEPEAFADKVARFNQLDKTGIDIVVSSIKQLGAPRGTYWLHILWSIAACWQHKGACFDKGAVHACIDLASEALDEEATMAVATIIQNLSEHVFNNAERNPNQVKILQAGVLNKLPIFFSSKSVFVRFISCNTLANLAVCEANRQEIIESGLLKHLTTFTRETSVFELKHDQIYGSWLGLGPHTGLLPSDIEEVQEFALFNLCQFADPARKKKYQTMLWRDLSMVDGPVRIQDLAESKNEHVSKHAKKLMALLDITPKYPVIRNPKSATPTTAISTSDEALFGNEQFSDVSIVAEGKAVPAHRVILASRCPFFAGMFSSGFTESGKRAVELSDVSYETLHAVIKFIYTGKVQVSVSTAVDLIESADMFVLPQLREACEYFLLQYVDHDNVVQLFQVASRYNCAGLRRFAVAFMNRNLDRLRTTEDWSKLSEEEQSEIRAYVSLL